MPPWSTGEKSQVQGHLNVPEDKSHRGWQACDGSCGLHGIHTIVKDGYPGNLRGAALPSQPRDILRTAEQRQSGYCRNTLFPGGPCFLPVTPPLPLAPETLISPWPEMTTTSTKLWDLRGSHACSHSAVHTVTGLCGELHFQRLRRQARYRIESRMV